MSVLELVDERFHRAVDIVQSLPKGGPVQTSYEEKLWLYALYKQATEGDISIPRPGMLDMLGRAKWDSWSKQRGTEKIDAKRQYVSALVKILKRYSDMEPAKGHIAELQAYSPHSQHSPTMSPSSSTSSFHSSRASPPPSVRAEPNIPLASASASVTSAFGLFPPPDPSLPVPDVSEEFVPPSALTASHRSLLNLNQSPPHLGEATSGSFSNQGLTFSSGTGAGPSTQALGHLPPFVPLPTAISRTHSLAEGHAGRGGSEPSFYPSGQNSAGPGAGASRKDSAYSARHRSGLGYLPEQYQSQASSQAQARHQSHQQMPLPLPLPLLDSRPYTPQIPNPTAARDFATPDLLSASPYIGLNPATSPFPYPPRPGSASTFTQLPLNITATLQQIQTSLTALHERLAMLERTQAMILRREERRKGWFFFHSKSDDELDELEVEGSSRRDFANTKVATATATATAKRRKAITGKGRIPLRVVWFFITSIRRAMLDLGVGMIIALVGVVVLGGGWRTARVTMARLRARLARFINEP